MLTLMALEGPEVQLWALFILALGGGVWEVIFHILAVLLLAKYPEVRLPGR